MMQAFGRGAALLRPARGVDPSICRRVPAFRWLLGCVGGLGIISSPGCNLFQDDGKGQVAQSACNETLAYLEQTAWPTVLGTVCAECHTPGGQAPTDGSDFVLLPPGYPNFQESNLANLRAVAAYEVDDKSVLLLKPTGELDHGGGPRIKEGSTEYLVLEELVRQLASTEDCTPSSSIVEYDDVSLLSASRTFRKAALHLGYRLPTGDEYARLADEGEDALPSLLDELLKEPAFYERLKDIFNDKLLTERYLAYTGYALNILDQNMYPQAGEPWEALTDEEQRRSINHALADEPLDYVAYLVKNDKPFTDVVEGNYMVVSPLTASWLNADAAFIDASDPNEFVETPRRGIVEWQRESFSMGEIPSAGILTSPYFLNRYPTTDTNKNRHRARMILDIFLGTDILKVGDRPLDPTQAGLYPNPTQNDPSCASCHDIIDPIAGAFQKYDDNDQERYRPLRSWYGEMLAAGYGGEQMPTDQLWSAPRWLGKRIARDPRFPYAMVKIVHEGLFGRPPVAYPEDYDADDYTPRFHAWRDQEALFQSIGQRFVESGFNLKVVFKELVLSPNYRATATVSSPDDFRELELGELGTARLSTPMLQARKIEAVTGLPWTRGWDTNDNLMTDYRILYGGINSDTITKRLKEPNGVIASVAWRMANEMSCRVAGWDFYLPVEQRRLFPHVQPTDAPAAETGDAADRIRQNIVHLHEQILGETLEVDDPEVERTYRLFRETYELGQALMADEASGVGQGLPWSCRVREDRVTGEALAEGAMFENDELYTVRAWMAVLTYLFSDYHFLYE